MKKNTNLTCALVLLLLGRFLGTFVKRLVQEAPLSFEGITREKYYV